MVRCICATLLCVEVQDDEIVLYVQLDSVGICKQDCRAATAGCCLLYTLHYVRSEKGMVPIFKFGQ